MKKQYLAILKLLIVFINHLIAFNVYAHADIEERIAVINQQIAEQPNKVTSYVRRAHFFAEHLQWKHALSDLDKATELNDVTDEIAFERSIILRQWYHYSGDDQFLNQAYTQVIRFLRTHPEHSDALLLRARLHRSLEETEQALTYYKLSIALTPNPRVDLFTEHAEYLRSKNRFDEAILVLEHSANRIGSFPLQIVRTALKFEELRGSSDTALVWFERLPSKLKTLPNELMLKGDLLNQVGRIQQAQQTYCKAFKTLTSFSKRRRQLPAFADIGKQLSIRLERPCL